MRLGFAFYGRFALGRRLGELVEILDRRPLSAVRAASLRSREGRQDLALDVVLASARDSSSDTCRMALAHGALAVSWWYGPTAGPQDVNGVLTVGVDELPVVRGLLEDLARWNGAIYGYCDQQRLLDADVRAVNGALWRGSSFYGLYWYNRFGAETRRDLAQLDDVRARAGACDEHADGSLTLWLGERPGARDREQAETAIARLWPVFRKYRPEARFSAPLDVDYSEVRGLAQAPSGLASIASVVGPADEFIASVSDHARRFHEWAHARGVVARSEADLRRVLREHESVIRDELLVPAIAAYGEAVREAMSGVWRKALVVHRGEPVVSRPGQPWSARRVVLEVLEMWDR